MQMVTLYLFQTAKVLLENGVGGLLGNSFDRIYLKGIDASTRSENAAVPKGSRGTELQ
jgi:hypothetical protein